MVYRTLEQMAIPEDEMDGYIISELGLEVPLTIEGVQFAIEELKGKSRQTVNA